MEIVCVGGYYEKVQDRAEVMCCPLYLHRNERRNTSLSFPSER